MFKSLLGLSNEGSVTQVFRIYNNWTVQLFGLCSILNTTDAETSRDITTVCRQYRNSF